jgi:phosphoglycolate phosphatase
VRGVAGHTLACFGLIGTTVIDDGILERAFAEAIATQGVVTGTSAYARGMAQVHRARGQAVIDVLRTLFPGNEARAQAASLAFGKSLSGSVERCGVRSLPGVSEALDELAGSGYRICVFSSLSHRQVGVFLAALGWRDRIDLALGADDAPRGCPAPDLVLQAMLQLGVDNVRETVVAHATESGVLAGRRAGASVVAGVLTGTHPVARLRQAGATHVLASVADLPEVLAAAGAPGMTGAGISVPRQAEGGLAPVGDPERAQEARPQRLAHGAGPALP